MEDFLRQLNNPFFYGFASALLLCLGGWILGGGPRRLARTELRRKDAELRDRDTQLGRLRDQLHTQMEINQRGNDSLKRERDELAERVKNLEINVATLNQKPGKAERRQLSLYQGALDRLFAEAPGFATAWQQALSRTEADLSQQEKGIGGFLRGFVTKALPGGATAEEEAEDRRAPTQAGERDNG